MALLLILGLVFIKLSTSALIWGLMRKAANELCHAVPKCLRASLVSPVEVLQIVKYSSSVYDMLIEDYESNPQKSIGSVSIQSNGKRLIRHVRTNVGRRSVALYQPLLACASVLGPKILVIQAIRVVRI